ncbi:dihydrodipicolinate synthase family protein [Arthrobacter psychrolactophilus]|nr:dihydrodipicolinate synthase family protein [Arthrobacter psychrolactophilus]
MNSRLTGVIPPVLTPLNIDGSVDVASLKALLDFLLEGGVSGLFVLGSSSEVAYLTDAQRALVLEVTVNHVSGRVPVLAGVIDMTTPRVIEHAKVAKELGADGLVATAPFYTRVSDVEIERHFRGIRAAVDLPLYAYDIPVCVHSKLSAEMLIRLGSEGVLAGIKDSSGDEGSLRGVIIARRNSPALENFSILTGSELTVDSALNMGADGVVPGLGNVDPSGYVRLFDFVESQRFEEARQEQERLHRLFKLVGAGNPERMGPNSSAIGAFKTGLMLQGVFSTHLTAEPQVPLNEEEIAVVAQHLEQAGISVALSA